MHHKRRSRRKSKGCDCSWCSPKDTTPVEGEVCMGKSRPKKPRPKKDKCPVNRTHEWYKERVTETDRFWSAWLYPEPGWRSYTRTYDKWTCIHCWAEKTKTVREPYRWSGRKLKLKKRQVKF